MLRALLVSLLAAIALIVAVPAVVQARSSARMVTELTGMGVEFWHARGVAVCDEPIPHITELPDEVAGVQAAGCQFWISATLARQAARERWRPHRGGDSARANLCTTVFHELGHAAGLQHTETGLMSELAPDPPGDCTAWVHRKERRERRAWLDRKHGVTRMSG